MKIIITIAFILVITYAPMYSFAADNVYLKDSNFKKGDPDVPLKQDKNPTKVDKDLPQPHIFEKLPDTIDNNSKKMERL